MKLEDYIRVVPDFPKSGINFYDIVPIMANSEALRFAIDQMCASICEISNEVDLIAGIEARGFPFASAVAYALGTGLVLVRKSGKLPGKVLHHEYALEYGTDVLEISSGVIEPCQRVVLIDDVLATGGTAHAAASLLQEAGAKILKAVFLLELEGLNGSDSFDFPNASLMHLPA